jgi:hypothetical protein
MRDFLLLFPPGPEFATARTSSYSRLSGLGRRLTRCRSQIGRFNLQRSILLVIVLSCCLPRALFGANAPAALTSPAPGSVLSGSSVTFSWTAGTGVTAYAFHVGTTGTGSSDLFDSGGIVATSVLVSGLPTNGGTIYATLYSDINGVWQSVGYTYTTKNMAPAAFASPAPGGTLSGSSVTFSWTSGAGVSAYELWLGTSGLGSSSLYNSGGITANSVKVTGLPTRGATIYATLYSDISGVWTPVYATYTEAASVAVSALSCSSSIMHVLGTYACTITLTAAAPSGGITVSLASSGAAITLPVSATIPANATSTTVMADVVSLAAQTVTLTATAGGVSKSFAIQLSPTGPNLSTNATSVTFGTVAVNSTATQGITLTSNGTTPVTISTATVTGSGFTTPGATFPITLNPGQAATVNVQFKPAAVGAVSGSLTIHSNSLTASTSVVSLIGTGAGTSYQVDLSWEAPASSAVAVVGYDVYRAVSGSSAYTLMNASLDTMTTFLDKTVLAGVTYDYIIESVDSAGVKSAPSNVIVVTIP